MSRLEALSFRGLKPPRLEKLLARKNNRGAITGAHGSGKTTLLEEYTQYLRRQERPVLRLRLRAGWIPALTWWHSLAPLGPVDTLVLDGAEQLSWTQWLRFRLQTRRVGTVIVSTHRPGRFPVLYNCTTDLQLLVDLTAALGHPIGAISAQHVFAGNNGNIRECLRTLYDSYAAR